MKKIRLVLIYDHPFIRLTYRLLIKKNEDMEIIGEYVKGLMAFNAILILKPDILVTEYYLPDTNALNIMSMTRERGLNTRLVILTESRNLKVIHDILNSEVSGYILKEDAAECLVPTINRVMEGDRVLSPSVNKYLNLHFHSPSLNLGMRKWFN